ncbi:hypothetical protein EPI10_031724 [Gossypium australe]|uniref:Uncharacterized protein n=1 Tax=Gossypium australe TaxID=47621 RepID=A0A5B6X2D8_9ROSI|nr:hypothetical protein EPI10_031724 [Gossypium australe]
MELSTIGLFSLFNFFVHFPSTICHFKRYQLIQVRNSIVKMDGNEMARITLLKGQKQLCGLSSLKVEHHIFS